MTTVKVVKASRHRRSSTCGRGRSRQGLKETGAVTSTGSVTVTMAANFHSDSILAASASVLGVERWNIR